MNLRANDYLAMLHGWFFVYKIQQVRYMCVSPGVAASSAYNSTRRKYIREYKLNNKCIRLVQLDEYDRRDASFDEKMLRKHLCEDEWGQEIERE